MARLLTVVLLSIAIYTSAHSHSHEAPHLKYGREINEAAQRGEDTIGHGHSHSHHDHSHDEEEDHFHHGHAHSHEDTHSHDHLNRDARHEPHSSSKKSKEFHLYDKDGYLSFLNNPLYRLWTYAMGSTFLISAIPCFMLTFIPLGVDTENSPLLKVLLAFGAGGLLGDAFLHLIPHSGHGHTHSHSHSHGHGGHAHDNSVGIGVLGGLLFFFVSEKLLRILTGSQGHSHDTGAGHPKKPARKQKKAKQSDSEDSAHETEAEEEEDHDHKHDEMKSKRVVAWLNNGADFLHNITDGLAIGASFITSTPVGIFTTIMVFFHEIPHEIGDFAFLIRTGHSKIRAQLTQLATALGAFGGCAVALMSVNAQELNDNAQSSWVQPFTAGGFIYIAAVSILPELLEKSSFLLTIAEVIAMCTGVLFMHVITLYE